MVSEACTPESSTGKRGNSRRTHLMRRSERDFLNQMKLIRAVTPLWCLQHPRLKVEDD
jgi:hypothetical protein